jgi:hypothetical protein
MRRTISLAGSVLCLLATACAIQGDDSSKKPEVKRKPIVEGQKTVFIETEGEKRRVILETEVCLREGQLEQLVTRKNTKEHEAILTVDSDARLIHAALLAAGAQKGAPVKFDPKFVPPSGTRIKISLQYDDNGKTVTVDAKDWLRLAKGKKVPKYEWVFAGSQLVPNRLNPKEPPYYLANDGDVICVSNFETALLDLNIESSKDNAELNFEANTEKIPPKGTKVTVILEPVSEEKKDK